MTFHHAKESAESTTAGIPAAKGIKALLIAVHPSHAVGAAWMNAAKGTRAIWISSTNVNGGSAAMGTMVLKTQTFVKNEISRGPIDIDVCKE